MSGTAADAVMLDSPLHAAAAAAAAAAAVAPAATRVDASAIAEAAETVAAAQQPAAAHKRHAPPPRPSHFLAVPTCSTRIKECIGSAQAALVAADPEAFSPCIVDAAGAHLTVLVMNLEEEGALERAGRELEGLGKVLREGGLLVPLRLELRGLGHFRRQVGVYLVWLGSGSEGAQRQKMLNRNFALSEWALYQTTCLVAPPTSHLSFKPQQVLFLEVAPSPSRDQLAAVAAAAVTHFRTAGLLHEDGKPFSPHVTIAKTSRLLSNSKRRRRDGGRGGGKGGGRGKGVDACWGH